MSSFLAGTARAVLWLCVVLTLVIIAALSVQIFSRYVLGAPVHMTDDIAEISLIWITFLGAAAVYREHGHIGVDIITSVRSEAVKRVIRVAIHVLVVAVLGFVIVQVVEVRPLMSRLDFGTLPRSVWTSKFILVLLPFGIGALLTIAFALEAIWLEFKGNAPK